ncbi:AAA family ATPase [Streptomyces sp. NPDC000410]|uniref:helix-turn-helix transcriptional regulator n=1 Tax=Streptomyces sp. NPDC000410 TaxID=3154254 RepID=UPI003331A488
MGDLADTPSKAGAGEPGPPGTGWVGRAREVAELRTLLANLEQGRGGCALIEGEPGIGKSALLAEAFRDVDDRRCTRLGAEADELSVKLPLRMMTQALHSSPATAEALAQQTGRAPAEGASLWVPGAADPVLSAVESVLRALDQSCAARPVLLVLDDLHWADEASLLVMNRLVAAIGQLPLLMVCTTRRVPRRPEVTRLLRTMVSRGASLIRLEPLSTAETVLMTSGLLGSAAGPELSRQIELTGGNPFYIRELTDSLVRERRLATASGTTDLIPTDEAADIPASLSAAIADRLGFLSEEAVELLKSATLLGSEFTLTDLAVVIGRPVRSLVASVEETVAADVLADGSSRLRFRHPLIREALYQSVPYAVRVSLHLEVAQSLSKAGAPPARVAGQLASLKGALDNWALDWLLHAGPELRHQAPQLTTELLVRAQQSVRGNDPRRDTLEALLATIAFQLSRGDDVERAARQVLARTTDAGLAGEMTWALAYSLLRSSRSSEAVEILTQGPRRWPLDPVWQARLSALRALTLYASGVPAQALRSARAALDEGRRLVDPLATAYALLTLSLLAARDRDCQAALDLADQAITVLGDAPEFVDPSFVMRSLRLRLLTVLDRYEEATAEVAYIRAGADRAAPARVAMTTVVAAELAFQTGRWDDCVTELEAVEDLPESWFLPMLLHGLSALVAVLRNRLREARVQLARASQQSIDQGGPRSNGGYLLMARALLAEREGKAEQAVAILNEELGSASVIDSARPLWLPVLVRLALSAGHRTPAERAAALVAAELATDSCGVLRAVHLHCQGLLADDPEALVAATEAYRATGRPLPMTMAMDDAALLLARSGDMVRCRALLQEAASSYHELGAAWLLTRMDAAVREYGIRRGGASLRRRPVSGWEALTPTEQRIARLAAQGLSNPDIADRLVSSRRTVQTHVSHILGKLGLHSRNEIARVAAANPEA